MQDLQIIIGFTGQQAWHLTTDAEVLVQMQRAACHRAWEGMVRHQREDTEVWTSGLPGFRSVKNARRIMTCAGRITEELEKEGDPDSEFNWQCWKLRLEGKLNAGWSNSTVTAVEASPWRSTDTEELHGYFSEAAPEWLSLRFEQGQPHSAIASAGLEEVDLQDTDSAHHGSRGRVLGPQSGALPEIVAPENRTLRH